MAKKRANGEGSIRKRSDALEDGTPPDGTRRPGKPIYKNVLGKNPGQR